MLMNDKKHTQKHCFDKISGFPFLMMSEKTIVRTTFISWFNIYLSIRVYL